MAPPLPGPLPQVMAEREKTGRLRVSPGTEPCHRVWSFPTPNLNGYAGSLLAATIILLFLLLADAAYSQRAFNWRVYKAADGLNESDSTAITVSPQGHVWIKHGEAPTISWLDGYEKIHHIPSPGGAAYRVYESRSGQIWSLYDEGIQEFKEGQWIHYPIPEIRSEKETNPYRRVLDPVSLLPGETNRVLFLVSDRLLEFNASLNKTTVLLAATNTRLGEFLYLAEAPDTSLWITGNLGLARLSAVARREGAAISWLEFIPPADLSIHKLQRPIADDEGGITVVANKKASNERLLVYFDGRNWQANYVLAGKIFQGWRGLEGNFWGRTFSSLCRLEPGRQEILEKDPLAGQIFDVEVEPKGVFWLATSEGLIRYAPLAWRAPAEMAIPNALSAILQDQDQRLWCASSTSLLLWENGRWQAFDYHPDKSEVYFQPTDALFTLPDHRLVINATNHILLFDPATKEFTAVKHPAGNDMRVLGQFREGAICVQTFNLEPSRPVSRLETFDGHGFRVFGELQPNWGLEHKLSFSYAATNNDLWLGGNTGLILIRDNKSVTFNRADGEPPEAAFCLLEVSEGKLWCGGQGKIHEFDGRIWTVVRGDLDRVNRMIRTRDGAIWVATSDGLLRYFNGIWLVNGVEEGLPSATVYAVFQDQRGALWAGTARGLSRFHPDADIDPPRTFINTANKQHEFYMDTPMTLLINGYDKWKFTASDHLLFSHRLDNVKWSPFTPDNAVLFNELTPGKHHFEARAMDRNGNMDDAHPAVFEISVILPWYLERRLLIAFTCSLVASLFFAWVAVNRHLRLKRSFAEVEKMVAKRTHELEQANHALFHSQKMQALGTLAAGIAHDFNSILSIIKGSAQIIEGHLEDKDKIRTRVDRIKTVVDQGAGIVKAMLGYSREPNRQLAPAEINLIVEETTKLLGDQFLQEIALQRELSLDLPPVFCARDLVQQMLVNLILNAADAMGGRGQVTVRTGILDVLPDKLVLAPSTARPSVYIAVQDRGCGIPPEILSRIFEPFFTTKAFSSRRGTGLGLSMVYEFAKAQNFGLKVDSEVGQGSTFTILMPA